MPPKKGHVGRKFKGQSDNLAFRAAKAASDAAVQGCEACRVVSANF